MSDLLSYTINSQNIREVKQALASLQQSRQVIVSSLEDDLPVDCQFSGFRTVFTSIPELGAFLEDLTRRVQEFEHQSKHDT